MAVETIQRCRVAIIGAGPGGMITGVRLMEAGIEDFVILERCRRRRRDLAPQPVPGPVRVTSRRTSTRSRSRPSRTGRGPSLRQPEILAYIEEVVARFDLRPLHPASAPASRPRSWDDEAARWESDNR